MFNTCSRLDALKKIIMMMISCLRFRVYYEDYEILDLQIAEGNLVIHHATSLYLISVK